MQKFKRIPFVVLLVSGLIIVSCAHEKEAVQVDKETPELQTEGESISQVLAANNHLPVAERIAIYHALKKDNPNNVNLDEAALNIYGYGLLWNNKTKEAIEIFKLVVAEFPESANAYDSLGEAYLADKKKDLSLLNYEKSLALNPDNFGAEDQIERIKFPEKKQLEPRDKFNVKYSAKQYKEDLDQYGKKIIEVHPSVFKFISKENFWNLIEDKKSLVNDETTYAEFAWHCSEIIASINCAHTSTGGFYPESSMLKLPYVFPVQTLWLNDKLYVVDQMNNADRVKIKDEIISINNHPVDSIVHEAYKHIPAQGKVQTTKRREFNSWSTEMIPYVLGFPSSYSIHIKGQAKAIALKPATKYLTPYADPSIKRSAKELHLEFSDQKTAILTISSFNFYPFDNRIEIFEKFMDSTFALIQEKQTKNLIIDVRFNGGGSSESSMYLLQYLMDKPFKYISSSYQKGGVDGPDSRKNQLTPFANRFKGKVYFLIDGHGNSTTGHFMSLAKIHKIGTIIGEELGSNQFCSAGQTPCRLSHTKFMFYVASNVNLTTATSLPDEIGILPDYPISQSIDDYVKKIDTVKEFAFELIKK